jgi:hypothetical protein
VTHRTHRAGGRRTAPALIAFVLLAALYFAGAAQAADGTRVFTSGPLSTSFQSTPVLSWPVLVWADRAPLPPPDTSYADARVWACNLVTGQTWPVTTGTPSGPQILPSVLVRGGVVRIVWEQRDTGTTPYNDSDIWIWQGTTGGVAAPTYPRALITGAGSAATHDATQQFAPSIGVAREPDADHVVVAWQDDRDNPDALNGVGGPTPQIFMLDLSADSDHNGTPDYEELGFDPATAGRRVETSGPSAFAQRQPSVGPAGIFWIDDRNAVSEYLSQVWRWDPLTASVGLYSQSAMPALSDSTSVAASRSGAAWLGAGPYPTWSEVYRRTVGKPTAAIVPPLFPGSIAATYTLSSTRDRFAIAGFHGVSGSGDLDVFFWDSLSGQTVPVCNVGSNDRTLTPQLNQASPAPAAIPGGGTRVVWSDARDNPPGTTVEKLVFHLYQAVVPDVSIKADRLTIRLGASIKLSAGVAPKLAGHRVWFQRGTRYTDSIYGATRYKEWKTISRRTLTTTSSATMYWEPRARGTYYVRIWFTGGAKTGLNHVPNASRIVKIVVL